MSEYPEDIMKAARATFDVLPVDYEPQYERHCREAIAAALLAERERCVKVVREMLVYADTTSASDEAIAQRILKGGAA